MQSCTPVLPGMNLRQRNCVLSFAGEEYRIARSEWRNSMLYIYLDQNKWIDLTKAIGGKPDGARYVPVLHAARQAVRDGKALFPLSSFHIMETAKSPRAEQRKLLAEIMTEFSQGIVLRAASQLVPQYLGRAVQQCFDEQVTEPAPTPFSRGVEDAFNFDVCQVLGISKDRGELLRSFLDTPEAWRDLLSYNQEAERKAGITSVRTVGVQAADKNEDARAQMTRENLDTIRRTYAATLTMNLRGPLLQSLLAAGKSPQQWGALGFEKLMDFWMSIPCLHVELELHTQKHRQNSKKWEANDTLDIGALSLAVPACDIIVTERFWVSLISRRGLDRAYNAKVLSDLTGIIDEL